MIHFSRFRCRWLLRTVLIVAGLNAVTIPGASAGDRTIAIPGNTTLRTEVTTYLDLRFKQIIRQRFDLSCGAAALATLMRYGWGLELEERDVIDGIAANASEEQRRNIEQAGFSLLELKRFGEQLGFAAGGFKVDDVEMLSELKVPAITLTNIRGYNHFVVIKGVRDGRVFVADPAFGNRVRTFEQFDEEWNSVILVFTGRSQYRPDGFTLQAGAAAPTRELVALLSPVLSSIRPQAGEF